MKPIARPRLSTPMIGLFSGLLAVICFAAHAAEPPPPVQGEGFVCKTRLNVPQPNGSGDFGYIHLRIYNQPYCMGALVASGNIYTTHAVNGQPWEHYSEAGLMAMHQTLYLALRDGTRVEYFHYPETGTGTAPHFGIITFAGR